MSTPYHNEHGVLYNKFNLDTRENLREIEYEITSLNAKDLLENKQLTSGYGYNLDRLKVIHEYLFQDVYHWAGRVRTVPYSKNMGSNGLTTIFAHPADIQSRWDNLALKTQEFVNASGLSFSEKVDRLTDIFIEANHLHPFPEGNGRSLQVFMRQLAKEQGVDLDYRKISEQHNWNEASGLSSVHGIVEMDSADGKYYLIPLPPNTDPIRQIFHDIASPIPEHNMEANADQTTSPGTITPGKAAVQAHFDTPKISTGTVSTPTVGTTYRPK